MGKMNGTAVQNKVNCFQQQKNMNTFPLCHWSNEHIVLPQSNTIGSVSVAVHPSEAGALC